jgi:hypothetical protein
LVRVSFSLTLKPARGFVMAAEEEGAAQIERLDVFLED